MLHKIPVSIYEMTAIDAGWTQSPENGGFWFNGSEHEQWSDAIADEESNTYSSAEEICENERLPVTYRAHLFQGKTAQEPINLIIPSGFAGEIILNTLRFAASGDLPQHRAGVITIIADNLEEAINASNPQKNQWNGTPLNANKEGWHLPRLKHNTKPAKHMEYPWKFDPNGPVGQPWTSPDQGTMSEATAAESYQYRGQLTLSS